MPHQRSINRVYGIFKSAKHSSHSSHNSQWYRGSRQAALSLLALDFANPGACSWCLQLVHSLCRNDRTSCVVGRWISFVLIFCLPSCISPKLGGCSKHHVATSPWEFRGNSVGMVCFLSYGQAISCFDHSWAANSTTNIIQTHTKPYKSQHQVDFCSAADTASPTGWSGGWYCKIS